MNRGLSLLASLAALLLLAGCTISRGGSGDGGVPAGPFPNDDVETVSVQPTFDSEPVRRNVTLDSGESRVYRADISDSVAQNNDVVYFDAVPASTSGGSLKVTAYSVSGDQATPLYASVSNEWFGRANDPALSSYSSSQGFSPASISPSPGACGGPCVMVPTPATESTAYIRVEATQSTATFDLYVVATDFNDLNEPNDTYSSRATVYPDGASFGEAGAIEVIGDVDWYVPSQPVTGVTFTSDNNLRLRAQVYDEFGNKLRLLFPGDPSYTAQYDQVLRVEVYSDEDQQRASSPGRAQYFVDFY